ncbi:MAG: M6 family metalloprotease domain-containing protein [Bacteroidaceae bacterium]|nr:M6 family metalloprotease domain-containing protein [Bacteroidaceae bacterium]
MRKRIVPLIISCICVLTLWAIPAKRERCTLTLPDGSKVEATFMGDEHLHFYLTDDGRYLLLADNDTAHYVEQDAIQARWQARASKRKAALNRRNAARQARQGQQHKAMTGSKRGLVILVDFPDVPFYFAADTFERFFNETGYHDGINVGSVHDYFLDASYGKFDFSFDVVGPVTMSHPLEYYGENDAYGYDMHPGEMIAEAIGMVDEQVDFTAYDWDKDGEVEQVYVIHSGYDEANRSSRTNIWSHAWTLTEAKAEGDGDGPVTADGVRIDSYATSAELQGKGGLTICGIGTACHEFAHCFGLPDTYDTNGIYFGLGSWDLMDYGEYNGNGGTPAGFTSYERMFCGWLDPIELTDPVHVQNMPALTSAPACYILRNSGKADEYYLLENRQQEGWDSCLGGHGMLVLHVDYDEQAWRDNTVNTVGTHLRMTFIPADNIRNATTTAGDTWPGTTGKTELSASSVPSAKLYNANADGAMTMNHSITNISETADGRISFIFDEGADGISAPLAFREKNTKTLSEAMYNLGGQQVAPGYHGIVIQRSADGKTHLIKTSR